MCIRDRIGVIFHLNDMKVNDIAVSFKDGAKDLIGAALVVAMAQGIMQVLGGSCLLYTSRCV